jgi:hypothetical protein
MFVLFGWAISSRWLSSTVGNEAYSPVSISQASLSLFLFTGLMAMVGKSVPKSETAVFRKVSIDCSGCDQPANKE